MRGEMREEWELGGLAPQEASHLPTSHLSSPECAALAPRTHPCLAKSNLSAQRKRKGILLCQAGHGAKVFSFTSGLADGLSRQTLASMGSFPVVGMVCVSGSGGTGESCK